MLDERLEWFGRHGVRECLLVHQSVRELEMIQFADGEFESRRFLSQTRSFARMCCPPRPIGCLDLI